MHERFERVADGRKTPMPAATIQNRRGRTVSRSQHSQRRKLSACGFYLDVFFSLTLQSSSICELSMWNITWRCLNDLTGICVPMQWGGKHKQTREDAKYSLQPNIDYSGVFGDLSS